MKININDKIYYATKSGVDTYIVTKIKNDTAKITYKFKDFISNANININAIENSPTLFTDFNEAFDAHIKMKKEFESQQKRYLNKILDEALSSPTINEVKKNGTLLTTKTSDDIEASLYDYNNNRYIIAYNIKKYEITNDEKDKICIRFSKV